MPRGTRGELRGAIHHVINRGNQRADIFHNDAEFQCFVDALGLGRAREIVPVRIYAFAVLNNHFHAVIEWGAAQGVSGSFAPLVRRGGRRA